jgi:hypothetical protein
MNETTSATCTDGQDVEVNTALAVAQVAAHVAEQAAAEAERKAA